MKAIYFLIVVLVFGCQKSLIHPLETSSEESEISEQDKNVVAEYFILDSVDSNGWQHMKTILEKDTAQYSGRYYVDYTDTVCERIIREAGGSCLTPCVRYKK